MAIVFENNKNVEEFFEQNETYLLKNESMNNLILGLSNSILKTQEKSEGMYFFTLKQNRDIVGQAIITGYNWPLVVTEMENKVTEFLASNLKKMKLDLKGVGGPKLTTTKFAERWCELNNLKSNVSKNLGVYELKEVISPIKNSGEMILAQNEHEEIISNYLFNFVTECLPEEENPSLRTKEIIDSYLKKEQIYLLEVDGRIVSMAFFARETRNTGTISYVFTPKELRGKGYASLIVSKLSEKILAEGKVKCNLYTDLQNPTSNSIYKKIGYRFLGECIEYHFKSNN